MEDPTRLARRIRTVFRELGARGCALWLFRRWRPGPPGSTYRLRSRRCAYPLHLRHASSDPDVFAQVFLDLEYGPLSDLRDVRLVVDCGANVGYSSAFLLSTFRSCRLIAVEADPVNLAPLQVNLEPYRDRVTVVHAGVWSHDVPLALSRGNYRDGREWATQVRACKVGERPDLQGVSIPSLLSTSGYDRISLLKIDIEGAEAVVFRGNLDWLASVDSIAIELHDDSSFGNASELFFGAMQGRGFEFSRSGELTLCRREDRARSS